MMAERDYHGWLSRSARQVAIRQR